MKDSFNTLAIELSKTLPQERRFDFIRLALTGEAEPEFLRYVETDKKAQAAVDVMFDKSAQALQKLADFMKTEGKKPLLGPKR